MLEESYISIISGKRRGIFATLFRVLLRAFELPYAIGSALKNRKYNHNINAATKVDAKVISIGNLTTGGTGKTPMVAWICNWLAQKGHNVCIVSRGYGSKDGKQNDEARELAQRLPHTPHLQNPDRIAAAQKAIAEFNSTVIVLDDGFQHRRLARDFDIVLIDTTNPFGFDHQLPRGLLRESIGGLQRAHAVILTRCDSASENTISQIISKVKVVNSQIPILRSSHKPKSLLTGDGKTLPLEHLQSKNVLSICGIGNPDGFQHTITESGMDCVAQRVFADHFSYDKKTIQELCQWSRKFEQVSAIVCTQKDLVKIERTHIGDIPLYAITIEIDFESETSELETTLLKVLPPT